MCEGVFRLFLVWREVAPRFGARAADEASRRVWSQMLLLSERAWASAPRRPTNATSAAPRALLAVSRLRQRGSACALEGGWSKHLKDEGVLRRVCCLGIKPPVRVPWARYGCLS